MCDICHHIPCIPGCPNESEKIIGECINCGDDILEGDLFYDSEDGMICEECLAEMSGKDLLDTIGVELKTA